VLLANWGEVPIISATGAIAWWFDHGKLKNRAVMRQRRISPDGRPTESSKCTGAAGGSRESLTRNSQMPEKEKRYRSKPDCVALR